jgi:hypothetical protein
VSSLVLLGILESVNGFHVFRFFVVMWIPQFLVYCRPLVSP